MTPTPTTSEELLLDSRDVATRPWQQFADTTGLYHRVLWRDPTRRSYAGLLHMDPGTSLPPHIHHHAAHHLWVVSGECTISGRRLDSGSYVSVPAGVQHGIDRAGRAGCLLFYLYLAEPQT
jgi:quercetin dioxygenase-like cupin family protein